MIRLLRAINWTAIVMAWLLVATGVVGMLVLFAIYLSEKIGSVILTVALLIWFSPFVIAAIPFIPFWFGLVEGRWEMFALAFGAWLFWMVALALQGLDRVLQKSQDNTSSGDNHKFPRNILDSEVMSALIASSLLVAVYFITSLIAVFPVIMLEDHTDYSGIFGEFLLILKLGILILGPILVGIGAYASFRMILRLIKKAGTTPSFVLLLMVLILSSIVDPFLSPMQIPMAIGAWMGKRKVDEQRAMAQATTDAGGVESVQQGGSETKGARVAWRTRSLFASLILLAIWMIAFPGIGRLVWSVMENAGVASHGGEANILGFMGGLLIVVVSGVVTYYGLRVVVKLVKGATTKATLLIFLGAVFVLSIFTNPLIFVALGSATIGGWLAKRRIDKRAMVAMTDDLTEVSQR